MFPNLSIEKAQILKQKLEEIKNVLDLDVFTHNSENVTINMSVLGNIKTSGGFLWREYQDNINDIELVPFIKKEKKLGKAKQKINQYTLDGEFIKCWDTITEAHRTLNIYLRSIRECCHGKVAQAKGFIWKYADETI